MKKEEEEEEEEEEDRLAETCEGQNTADVEVMVVSKVTCLLKYARVTSYSTDKVWCGSS